MKVVCVTSSASLGFRTSASANRYTSRTYRRYMRSKARSSTTLVAAIYPARTPLRPLRIWPLASLGGCGCPGLPVRDVDRAAERDEAGLLDRLGKLRMRRHAVGDRLDRRLGVDRDDTRFDHVGDMRADHDEAEELAVARLVDRLHPADRLVLH